MYNFNIFLYDVYWCLDGKEINECEQYIIASFSEIIKSYQAAIILLEYGLDTNFEMVLRGIFELVMKVLYVIKYEYGEIKRFKYIKRNRFFDIIPEELLNSMIDIYENRIDELEKDEIKYAPDMCGLCDDLNMKKEYCYYGFLSEYIHKGFTTIYKNVEDKGDECDIDSNPNYDRITDRSLRLYSLLEDFVLQIMERYDINIDMRNKFEMIKNKSRLLHEKDK